ncbi:hypothetical protein N7527_011104 [Penicillium freii]|nr:hypothetical protein N7527_011104 [Penicillium freii]
MRNFITKYINGTRRSHMKQESRICFKSSVRSSVATRTADTTIPHCNTVFNVLPAHTAESANWIRAATWAELPRLFVTIKHDLQVTLVSSTRIAPTQVFRMFTSFPILA